MGSEKRWCRNAATVATDGWPDPDTRGRALIVMDLVAGHVHVWHRDGETTMFSWVGEDPAAAAARVYALAFTGDGGILLVGDEDEEQWWLPGGGVEDGESDEQTLERELAEEAGATVAQRELLGYQRVDDSLAGVSHQAFYWCRITLPSAFVPRFEVTRNLVVRPDQFLDHLFWADDPTAARLLQFASELDRRC